MTLTRTHTRTHVYVPFANPYLRCKTCRTWLTGWHDPEKCGCDAHVANTPCGCRIGIEDTCPSWSPVDGCTCGPDAHDRPPTLSLGRAEVPAKVADCIPEEILHRMDQVRRGFW